MTSQAKEIVTKFYDAFVRKDPKTMSECYADDARFSDEVFQDLEGREIGGMWTMLSTRSKDLKVTYAINGIDGDTVHVLWHAYYTFSKTKRPVHNIIEGSLTVKNGKIVDHLDRFSFWKWSTQALGPVGLLLGWSPIVKNKVRSEARKSLTQFLGTAQGT